MLFATVEININSEIFNIAVNCWNKLIFANVLICGCFVVIL